MNEPFSQMCVRSHDLNVCDIFKIKGLIIPLRYLAWCMKVNNKKKVLISPVNTSLLPRQRLGLQPDHPILDAAKRLRHQDLPPISHGSGAYESLSEKIQVHSDHREASKELQVVEDKSTNEVGCFS